MTTGWWSNKKWTAMNVSRPPNLEPASTGLWQDAIEKDKVLYQNSLYGSSTTPYEEVLKAFQDLGGRLVSTFVPWRGDKGNKAILVWEDAAVDIDIGSGDADIEVKTTNRELYDKFQVLVEKFVGPKSGGGKVYVLVQTQGGLELQTLGVAACPLNPENYSPDVVSDFKELVTDLKSSDPTGRLAILDGLPGTGKTYLMRALLAEVPDSVFVVVPASLIPNMGNPDMITALMETRENKGAGATVFLIEDADDCLVARDSGNMNAVSSLLNLGDGILGAMFDLRLVCTTNAKNDELDEAITRPGRLSKKISVGPLPARSARALFKKLTGKDESLGEMTLAEIYRLAKGAGWKPVPRSGPMGFTTNDERAEAAWEQSLHGLIDVADAQEKGEDD